MSTSVFLIELIDQILRGSLGEKELTFGVLPRLISEVSGTTSRMRIPIRTWRS